MEDTKNTARRGENADSGDKKPNKKKGIVEVDPLTIYTGGNYLPYKTLIDIPTVYQQKEKVGEDIDYLQSIGGIEYLFEKLKTSEEKGIDSSTIQSRLEAFGTNRPPMVPVKGFCVLFVEALNDLTLIILMIAAVISIGVNMITEADHRETAWIEGFAILCAVFISAGVQAFQDAQREKKFAELNEKAAAEQHVQVIRDGKIIDINPSDCVVGDIVKVNGGDAVAGDSILIKGQSVQCDESSMTGESDALEKAGLAECIKKKEEIVESGQANTADIHEVPSPILLSGTNIQNGQGLMLVIAVGDLSSIGKIRKTLTDKADDQTPLQKKLHKIANDIGWFGLIAAIITLFIMIGRAFIDAIRKSKWSGDETKMIVEGFLIAVTVLVVAIPEGLPLAVTISLAFSVKKMLKEGNLVRKLHACETMGGAHYICSDKTGTLTLNKMYMIRFWNMEPRVTYEEKETTDPETGIINYQRNPLPYDDWVSEENKDIFHNVLLVNSNSDPAKKKGNNATDLAVTRYLHMGGKGMYAPSMRKQFPPISFEPFNSSRKRMSTFIEDSQGKKIMLIKGASEIIVNSCEKLHDLKTGDIIPIDEAVRQEIEEAIEGFAKTALRTIGLAYKYTDEYDNTKKDEHGVLEVESEGLTLIGIAGIRDVLRPEVPNAVKNCHTAGIQVKMVTGDNKETAKAIAVDCGIIPKGHLITEKTVMLGKDFFEEVDGFKVEVEKNGNKKYTVGNPEQFKAIYNKILVLARSRPDDKLTMVVGLRENGHVVAVTGDGTNDAPALSKANVGFAMGRTGTDIAKQAADILLTEDNFVAIVNAVKWGRNIYDSIRKFLQFQLTVNVVAVIITFISAAVTKEAVLSAVQMLWVNLIMDTLASLALATEPPTEELLKRKPISSSEYIVSTKMTKHIIGQAIYQLIIMLIVLFLGPKFLIEEFDAGKQGSLVENGLKINGYDKNLPHNNGKASRHLTYCFNIFVMMQVFNFINARKINDELNTFSNISKSPLFIIIVIIIFILQIIIVTIGNVAFRCRPWGLGFIGWGISLAFGIGGLIVNIFLKIIPEDKLCPKMGNKVETPSKGGRRMRSLSLRSQISLRSRGQQRYR